MSRGKTDREIDRIARELLRHAELFDLLHSEINKEFLQILTSSGFHPEETDRLALKFLKHTELFELALSDDDEKFLAALKNHTGEQIQDVSVSRKSVIREHGELQQRLHELLGQEVIRLGKALNVYRAIYTLAILGSDEKFLQHLQCADYSGDFISIENARSMVIRRHDELRDYLIIAARMKRKLNLQA